MKVSPTSIVVASPSHVSAALEDERVVLELGEGTYFGMRGVSRRIWELLDEPRSVAELVVLVETEYDVESGTAQRDLLSFIEELHQHDLVEVRDGSPD